jgi:hypothetical protein
LLLNSALAETGVKKERRRFNVFADLSYNSSSIDTKETDSTNKASTSASFSALEIGGDYFFHPRFAVTAQMLFKIQSSIEAGIKGFDAGVRYFPLNRGYKSEVQLLNSKIETTPGVSAFLYGGFSNREYQFSNSIVSFSGLEAGGGADLHLNQRSFIRFSLNYQMLQNNTTRSLSGLNAAIGYGYSF